MASRRRTGAASLSWGGGEGRRAGHAHGSAEAAAAVVAFVSADVSGSTLPSYLAGAAALASMNAVSPASPRPVPAGRQIDKKEETTTGGGALLRPLVLAVGRTYVRNGCSVRLACDRSVPDPAAGGDAIDRIDPSKREPGDGRTSAAAAGVVRKRGRRRSTEIDGAIFVGNLHCRILANRV